MPTAIKGSSNTYGWSGLKALTSQGRRRVKTGLSNVYSWLEQLTEERVMVDQLTVGGLNRLDLEIKLTERVRNDRVAR